MDLESATVRTYRVTYICTHTHSLSVRMRSLGSEPRSRALITALTDRDLINHTSSGMIHKGLTSVYLLRYCTALLTLFFFSRFNLFVVTIRCQTRSINGNKNNGAIIISQVSRLPPRLDNKDPNHVVSDWCQAISWNANAMQRLFMERERSEIKRAPLELIKIISRQNRHRISISRNTQIDIIPP